MISLPTSPLSRRQVDVVQLVADGLTDAKIAAELGVGVRTVRTHINEARAKLLASGRVHLAVQAIRHGVIT